MKTLPDLIVIDVMWTLCIMDRRLVVSIVSRYEFQNINRNGIIKWRPYLWKHYQIWLPLMYRGPYVALTVRLIGSTASRYEFQVINHKGIIKCHLYLWSTTRYDCHWCDMDLMCYWPSIDCIHSQQVWVSVWQPQRNNQMMLLIMKALPD